MSAAEVGEECEEVGTLLEANESCKLSHMVKPILTFSPMNNHWSLYQVHLATNGLKPLLKNCRNSLWHKFNRLLETFPQRFWSIFT